MIEPWIWPAGLGLLGLLFGSFMATIALRWPAGRSVARGRSACDSCGQTLRPIELVPVVSFVVQRGKCRRCGARIAPIQPAVEVLGLAVGVAAGIAAPGWVGVTGAVFGWMLLALAAIDLRAFWLPNLLTFPLALLGLGLGLVPFDQRLIGGLTGGLSLWAIAAGYRALRGRDGLGGGDPKLFAAIGCWLGWKALPMVMLGACVLGFALLLALRAIGHKMQGSDRLPLGALLAPAAFVSWLTMT